MTTYPPPRDELPLGPFVAFDRVELQRLRKLPDHLATPQQWAQAAFMQATELMGTMDAAEKLAEARRFLFLAQLLHAKDAEILELRSRLSQRPAAPP